MSGLVVSISHVLPGYSLHFSNVSPTGVAHRLSNTVERVLTTGVLGEGANVLGEGANVLGEGVDVSTDDSTVLGEGVCEFIVNSLASSSALVAVLNPNTKPPEVYPASIPA